MVLHAFSKEFKWHGFIGVNLYWKWLKLWNLRISLALGKLLTFSNLSFEKGDIT